VVEGLEAIESPARSKFHINDKKVSEQIKEKPRFKKKTGVYFRLGCPQNQPLLVPNQTWQYRSIDHQAAPAWIPTETWRTMSERDVAMTK
jgi:transposase